MDPETGSALLSCSGVLAFAVGVAVVVLMIIFALRGRYPQAAINYVSQLMAADDRILYSAAQDTPLDKIYRDCVIASEQCLMIYRPRSVWGGSWVYEFLLV